MKPANFPKTTYLIILITLFLCLSGCAVLIAGAVGGAATAVWSSGKLTQRIEGSVEDTLQSSKAALESLNLKISRETKKERVAQIISNYTDGKTIWVDIHKISEYLCRLEIRVGVYSDKSASQEILNEILIQIDNLKGNKDTQRKERR